MCLIFTSADTLTSGTLKRNDYQPANRIQINLTDSVKTCKTRETSSRVRITLFIGRAKSVSTGCGNCTSRCFISSHIVANFDVIGGVRQIDNETAREVSTPIIVEYTCKQLILFALWTRVAHSLSIIPASRPNVG